MLWWVSSMWQVETVCFGPQWRQKSSYVRFNNSRVMLYHLIFLAFSFDVVKTKPSNPFDLLMRTTLFYGSGENPATKLIAHVIGYIKCSMYVCTCIYMYVCMLYVCMYDCMTVWVFIAACDPPLYQYNNSCVEVCPPLYIGDHRNGTCLPCKYIHVVLTNSSLFWGGREGERERSRERNGQMDRQTVKQTNRRIF